MFAPSAFVSRTSRRVAVLAGAGLLVLSGCGTDDPPAAETDDEPQTIQLTITPDDDVIEPRGERINVTAGEPVTFEITADHEGSVHVHSTPEHSLDYIDGTVTREITLDQPGVVEVEIHDPDMILVQLAVR